VTDLAAHPRPLADDPMLPRLFRVERTRRDTRDTFTLELEPLDGERLRFAAGIRLSMERSMKCGVGLCGHCQLRELFLCVDGPVLGYDRLEPLMSRREL
jgi:NAD(P)H-flavin reductase